MVEIVPIEANKKYFSNPQSLFFLGMSNYLYYIEHREYLAIV